MILNVVYFEIFSSFFPHFEAKKGNEKKLCEKKKKLKKRQKTENNGIVKSEITFQTI